MTPGGGTNFDPKAIICTILLEVHTTQCFMQNILTLGFVNLEKMIFCFYYIHIRKTYGPRGGANFDTRGKI
jgi:hypothetical protein